MFADNTLTPKEAARLCALGTLAAGSLKYSALADSVRHFMSRIQGPSLDVMGTSIQLLKYEGLVSAAGEEEAEDDQVLSITDEGRAALMDLLVAPVRAQSSDLNKLIMALKFRFLHLLPADDQADQMDLLAEAAEGERARLMDLRQHHCGEAAGGGAAGGDDEAGGLKAWLDHEIEVLDQRIEWLERRADALDDGT